MHLPSGQDEVGRYRQHGVARIHHLPSSADPQLFRPLGIPRDPPVAFIGTRTEGRHELLEQLGEFSMQVFGPGWRKVRLGGQIRIHPPAFGAKTNEIYNRARINLNIHTWVGRGSAVKGDARADRPSARNKYGKGRARHDGALRFRSHGN